MRLAVYPRYPAIMDNQISRRTFLGASGLAAVGVGSLLYAPSAGAHPLPSATTHFDLAAASAALPGFKGKMLAQPKFNPQSLAYASSLKSFFITAYQELTNPTYDISLTRTDVSGNVTGSMLLKNFGHGTQIGVHYINGITWIWSEADNQSRIVRFPFQNGATITSTSSGVQDRTPPLGSGLYTASIDPRNSNLIVGRSVSGGKEISVYDLTQAETASPSSWKKLGGCTLSYSDSVYGSDKGDAWQGITVYDRYLYLFQGPVPNTSPKEAQFTVFDLTSGKRVFGAYKTGPFNNLPDWEPQGVAVALDLNPNDNTDILCMLVRSEGDGNHYASVAYKPLYKG